MKLGVQTACRVQHLGRPARALYYNKNQEAGWIMVETETRFLQYKGWVLITTIESRSFTSEREQTCFPEHHPTDNGTKRLL